MSGLRQRRLLLHGCPFATICTVVTICTSAGIASAVAPGGGGILLVLVALGLWATRRVGNPAERLVPGRVAQLV